MADDHKAKTVSAEKARQGPKGTPVIWVLLSSLALVLVVWFFAGLWGRSTEPSSERQPPAGVTSEQPAAN